MRERAHADLGNGTARCFDLDRPTRSFLSSVSSSSFLVIGGIR
jgi:hypothetical protein